VVVEGFVVVFRAVRKRDEDLEEELRWSGYRLVLCLAF
jgi:hypothetical protein